MLKGTPRCIRRISCQGVEEFVEHLWCWLLLTRCVWSGLTILTLSVSIFPGWMARHYPPDDCGEGPRCDGIALLMKDSEPNAHAPS